MTLATLSLIATAWADPSGLAALQLTRLDGTPLPPDTLSGKAVLFVNVASRCGYTPQYAGLQALHAEMDGAAVVVGVPCNQFGRQEPGSATEIASFCKDNYAVNFPLLEKQDVNGKDRSPLYAWLVDSEAGGGKNIRWNFEKFVVNADGTVAGRFPSKTAPGDPALRAALDAAVAKKPTK